MWSACLYDIKAVRIIILNIFQNARSHFNLLHLSHSEPRKSSKVAQLPRGMWVTSCHPWCSCSEQLSVKIHIALWSTEPELWRVLRLLKRRSSLQMYEREVLIWMLRTLNKISVKQQRDIQWCPLFLSLSLSIQWSLTFTSVPIRCWKALILQ
jgi:superfamily II helicase